MPTFGASAKELLAHVVERYAALSSYTDTGVVRVYLDCHDSPLEVRFSTSFRKPSRFKFEFSIPHPYPPERHRISRNIVGSDGVTAYLLTSGYDGTVSIEVAENLSMAIAGATGISFGSAYLSRGLLLPGDGFSLLDLVDSEFETETEIDGAPCWRIRAKHSASSAEVVLGIEKSKLFLRRWSQSSKEVDLRNEELRWDIRINESLDDLLFAVPTMET